MILTSKTRAGAMPDGDVELAVSRLRAIGGVGDDLLTLVHPGVPVAKERARAGKGGFYTPTTTRNAQQALSWAFYRARRPRRPYGDTVALVALFYLPNFRPKDSDNCLKLVMDAANDAKNVWRDDRKVMAHAVFFELDAQAPRTVVAIAPYRCSLSKAPLLTADDERI